MSRPKVLKLPTSRAKIFKSDLIGTRAPFIINFKEMRITSLLQILAQFNVNYEVF